MDTDLTWLPERAGWSELLASARHQPPVDAFDAFLLLANSHMDFVSANRLDKAITRYRAEHGHPPGLAHLRLAILGSSTTSHLLPGIRLGALRRGLLLDIYEAPFGLYRQGIADPTSALHRFRPEALCLALDADHLAGQDHASAPALLEDLRHLWHSARTSLGCTVIQQTLLPRLPNLLGNNEHCLAGSPAAILQQLNQSLRAAAAADGVHLLSIDTAAAIDGLAHWHDPALWLSSRIEIHPRATAIYGDQLGRLLAALRGRSSKCLVLDLDNTLWGGVIGDDGPDGITLGQGSATGEAHLALQSYALQLSRRGVLLAVCSKNDEATARAAFDHHPEMLLKPADIACFLANWRDKAANLRDIATRLNIGLDSLVFVDDNPAERDLIRRELPSVAVPELPPDPAGFVPCLARAGYFEALTVTPEDRERSQHYRANSSREDLRRSSTDLDSFLATLGMHLTWSSIRNDSLARIAQLTNKTNQFNLTTRRYTEPDLAALLRDPAILTLQLRLADIYGDNGLIAVVIARETPDRSTLAIDTWLMSCRILGRQVEHATLNLLAAQAIDRGCTTLTGEFRPSPRNELVRNHYAGLGFDPQHTAPDGSTTWTLPLDRFTPLPTHIATRPAPVRSESAR